MKVQSKITLSLIAAICALQVHAAPTFVDGVTLDAGWYDCNKRAGWTFEGGIVPPAFSQYSNGYYFVDDKMCWAHAASNILQWWQDKQPEHLISSDAPNGLAATAIPYKGANNMTYYYDSYYVQQLAIFQDITKYWKNNGGTVKRAYNWYFNGGTDALLGPMEAYNTSATNGGYYADLGLTLHEDGLSSDLFTSRGFYENSKAEVYNIIQSYINNNYGTTLSIGAEGSGHAISMWGYEKIGEDLIVYLTDSDDLKHALFIDAAVNSPCVRRI